MKRLLVGCSILLLAWSPAFGAPRVAVVADTTEAGRLLVNGLRPLLKNVSLVHDATFAFAWSDGKRRRTARLVTTADFVVLIQTRVDIDPADRRRYTLEVAFHVIEGPSWRAIHSTRVSRTIDPRESALHHPTWMLCLFPPALSMPLAVFSAHAAESRALGEIAAAGAAALNDYFQGASVEPAENLQACAQANP